MQNIIIFKNNQKIINKINYFLDPLMINTKFKLILKNGNNNTYYNNTYYNLMYTLYQPHINHFIELSKIITDKEAYEVLMIIPSIKKTFTNINMDIKLKMINYNYTWFKILSYYKLHLNIIKNLLNNYIEFYYIEMIYIYHKIKDIYKAYEIMNENKHYFYTLINIKNYYYLRIYNIAHFSAYALSKFDHESIIKMCELIKSGYNETKYLSLTPILTIHQIEFLKLSRLGYNNDEEFNKKKDIIFNNAINLDLINTENFEPKNKIFKYF
jgi:hypothetical protein